MKKIIVSLFAVLVFFTTVFAHDGIMSGEENLRVTKTKWFDIIYPERCEDSARLLYENADNIYEEIGEQYGFPPKERLPVVICPAVEQFNGYFSSYNLIVLYDTAMIDDLAVFSETFLSLFRHECIHAYTFNMRNGFWGTIGKVFGDAIPYVFSSYFISSGMAEGATVSGESAAGEGRLNDEYARQMVKQAAIEDEFPEYWDAQGSASIYPAGSFYYFNGTFNEWLQKKYGMEKYAKFWYKCVNFQALSTGRAFKKVYGLKIKQAWKQFQKEYTQANVPAIEANPVYSGQVKDFFEPAASDYSAQNNGGAIYTNLVKCDQGLAYLDEKTEKIYFIDNDNLQDEKIKPQILFSKSGLCDFSLSKDGRLLAVNYYDAGSQNVEVHTIIYDVENHKTYNFDDHGLYHPVIIQGDDGYYVVRQIYKTPLYGLQVDKLIFNNKGNKIDRTQIVSSKMYALNQAPLYVTDLGNKTYAFVLKDGLDFSICVNDLQGNQINKIDAPKERMVIRYLSKVDDSLYFSWAAPGTMPRLGRVNIDEELFELQEDDISGGVYYPVSLPNSRSLAYIGTFYRQNRLLLQAAPSLTETIATVKTQSSLPSNPAALPQDQAALPPPAALPSSPYRVIPNYNHFIWFPISMLTTKSYHPDYQTEYTLPLGVYFSAVNPWSTDQITLQAGYGDLTNSAALDVTYTGGTGTPLLTYSVEGNIEFNKYGWKKTQDTIDVRSQYPFGKKSYLVTEALSKINFGKADKLYTASQNNTQINLTGIAQSNDRTNYLYWNNAFLLGYTNVGLTGPGYYEKGGVTAVAILYHTYWANTTDSELYYDGLDVDFELKFNIPKLIPVICPIGYTFNLPSTVTFHLFPVDLATALDSDYSWSTKVFNTSSAMASGRVNTLLFGTNIEKATFIPWIYLHDIQISASYCALLVEKTRQYENWRFTKLPEYIEKMQNNQLIYEDYACLRATANFGPNVGGLANGSTVFGVSLEVGLTGLAGAHKTNPYVTLGGSALF